MSRLEPSPFSRHETAPRRSWLEWLRWIAVEDHCEWANPYVARLRTPLGVLILGAIAALMCGLFVAPQGFALFAAILAVIVLGLAWPSIAMRGVRGRLDFAGRRGREGKAIVADFVVVNRWPWPVWGLTVNDPLIAQAEGAEAAVALARIDGWSRATFKCTLTPSQRGEYPRGEVSIESGFPFGLYTAAKVVEVKKKLIVWPETFWLPPLADRSSRLDWRGEVSEACVGSQGARLGPREHRPGDTLRDVHWAKSARYDQLIVSEREAASVENHAILVDTDPGRNPGGGRDSTLEWSLRIAASIAEAVVDQRGSVTLWLGDKEIAAHAPGEELRRLLDAIALFEPRETAERGGVRRSRGAASVLAIGTERSPAQGGRCICLHTKRAPQQPSADAWIEVDPSADVAGQVLRGWRVGVRSSHRAS